MKAAKSRDITTCSRSHIIQTSTITIPMATMSNEFMIQPADHFNINVFTGHEDN
jgi:hypothetical protein